MSQRLDIEALATQSTFENVDDLAGYIARNSDVPTRKLAAATGLSVQQVDYLLTNKAFRERLTELITYTELTPEKERVILRRMLGKALEDNGDFKEFREAATWIYRQGGMLRAEKAQVEHGGAIRVSFALDTATENEPAYVATYVAPDPFAGVIGLPGSTTQGEELDGLMEEDIIDAVGKSIDETE